MQLNPMYTFDRYLPSVPRAIAPRMCKALAAGDLSQHRCLLLFGPPGTGKTHLLHAIGHAAHAKDAAARVVLISGIDLAAGLVEAIRRNALPDLNWKYAQANVLLVDNLEALAGRPATQAEVARILVACLLKGGVVAGAAACHPRHLRELTALTPPAHGPRNLEVTHVSRSHLRRILRQEAENWGLNPPARTVDHMATRSGGDARTALGEFARWHLEQRLSAGTLASAGVSGSACAS